MTHFNKSFRIINYSEGGFFKAHLHFPKEYPLRPPKMKFITEIWHPNSKSLNLNKLILQQKMCSP